MTNLEMIAKWHAERPEFTHHWTARDWSTAEEVAELLDMEDAPESVNCLVSGDPETADSYCTLPAGHPGECQVVSL